MKRLLFLLLLVPLIVPAQIVRRRPIVVPVSGLNGFTHNRSITIDHTKVPNTNQTDFPVLVSGTYTYLKTVGNGGFATDAQGDDIIFTSDSGCNTKLDHEVESWNGSTGAVIYWVKVPSVTTATDAVFYICYGKASITTTQENIAGVWSNSYEGVWHMKDGATIDTTNAVTAGTGSTANATASAGQIDGGVTYAGGISSGRITTDYGGNNSTRTFEIWTNRNGDGGGSAGRMFVKGTTATTLQILNFSDGNYYIDYTWSGSFPEWHFTRPSASAWHLISITYDSSSTSNDPLAYIDGSTATVTEDTAPSGTVTTNSEAFGIGNRLTDTARCWDGVLDEFRVSSVIRSADWIMTSFNSQNSPSTFYTVGTEN